MRRTKQTAPQIPQARLVADTADATRDKFIPLTTALQQYDEGKLVRVHIGPAYPNSFMRK